MREFASVHSLSVRRWCKEETKRSMLYLNQEFSVKRPSHLENLSMATADRSLKRIRRWWKSQTRLSENSREKERQRERERESSIRFKPSRQVAEDIALPLQQIQSFVLHDICALNYIPSYRSRFEARLIQFYVAIVIIAISARAKASPFADSFLSCSIVCSALSIL